MITTETGPFFSGVRVKSDVINNSNWTEWSTIHNGNRTEWSPILVPTGHRILTILLPLNR